MISFEAAPMEGITDPPFRRAVAEIFGGIDRFYTPFAAPNRNCSLKTREKRETAPENNSGVVLVPQILTTDPEIMIWFAREMEKRGWHEVNLNLGCPSPTVCSHHKGSAFLKDLETLDAFFDRVFHVLEPEGVRISVKTRIGYEEDLSEQLVKLFDSYPISELIVHPRLRSDFYRGPVRLPSFGVFYEAKIPALCYNGDICGKDSFSDISGRFPETERFMLGRGLVSNPALARELSGGTDLSKEELKRFHDRVFEDRLYDLEGFSNTVGKMKELWFYIGARFDHAEKALKEIRKAGREDRYRAAVQALFDHCDLKKTGREVSFS